MIAAVDAMPLVYGTVGVSRHEEQLYDVQFDDFGLRRDMYERWLELEPH